MDKLDKFTLNLLLILLLFFVCIPQKAVAAINPPLEYPSMMAYSWSWPGNAVVVNGVSRGGWDMLRWQFENKTMWAQTYKPKIKNDIQDLLWRHSNTIPNSNNSKRIAHVINIPVFVIEKERIKGIVDGFTEIAEELDTPIIFKVVGFVWWDWEGCPNCQNGNYTVNDLEWWGWSSDYIWAKDSPKSYGDPNNRPYVWRNWGTPFKIYIPHPHFNSTKFRALASDKIGYTSELVAEKLDYLYSKNKSHLIYAFIPENEVVYGWSFHPIERAGLQYGVRYYIEQKCPKDVLQCLPLRPKNVSREDWIKQKSDEMYRPDDYQNVLTQGANSYMSFVSNLAYSKGVPREKIISQSVFRVDFQKDTEFYNTAVFDIALNNVSVPGYSVYGNDIGSTNMLQDMAFLKSNNRNIGRLSLVEYLFYGSEQDWLTRFRSFLNTSLYPKIHLLVIQNWENVLTSIASSDKNYLGAVNIVNDYLSSSTATYCGNGVVESNETCDKINTLFKLPFESFALYPEKYSTCSNLPDYYSTNKTSCSSSCTLDVSGCPLLGDIDSNRAVNLTDRALFINNLFKNTFVTAMDIDKNGVYSLIDLPHFLTKIKQ